MLLKGEKYGGQKGPNITGQNIFIAAASETMPIKKKKKKHLWKPKTNTETGKTPWKQMHFNQNLMFATLEQAAEDASRIF